MILNQNKKISAKVDRKIKQTKSQFEWEFKTAVIEENKLLSIIIEDEYKENKGIAKFVWKSEEQISDFPWLNIEKAKKIFTEHYAKTNRIFASIREDVTNILQQSRQNTQEKLWEILFGSWNDSLNSIIKEKISKANMIKYLVDRTKTIKYIIEHPIITNESSSSLLHQLASFVKMEMWTKPDSANGLQVIGWHWGETLTHEIMNSSLFRWILNLNSTIGRAEVILKSNEIACHPSFLI